MRVPFSTAFQNNADGTITIIRPIRVGGVALNNVTLSGGINVAGVNLYQLRNKDLEAHYENGVLVIDGYYN
ncbi:hypothetical protein HY633_03875 [Candidatus Uhrbacteria bacterium]|nr:hypothetical protein [Candidatus Uhrbacteria bacterium]